MGEQERAKGRPLVQPTSTAKGLKTPRSDDHLCLAVLIARMYAIRTFLDSRHLHRTSLGTLLYTFSRSTNTSSSYTLPSISLLEALESFVVVEREGQIIACAALFPFLKENCAEVASIAVSPECRGQGQGDKLLDYIEKKASSLGIQMLFLLTTRTADWFVRRGFSECSVDQIPVERRKRINLSRGSKYYMKRLQPDRSGIIRFGTASSSA
ncbi:unnamed protein product [Cuscuta campestris]|uniref:N-acetyltransferase domain-containing protein n=1 Tax=Cuscuta campestris TaxID=132261 RepID=A0A484JY78_9ASTE|nr:unnamed protein product [Cuscuta campestris]